MLDFHETTSASLIPVSSLAGSDTGSELAQPPHPCSIHRPKIYSKQVTHENGTRT
uniref:Uncharacterized protein n=1 Tax=Arundo donax TaxID=35708 RepID=A0A0A9HVW0_ARUDO